MAFTTISAMPPIMRLVASMSLALMLAACGGAPTTAGDEVTFQVRGRILEVVPRNISEVEVLRIREESGRELTFTTEGFVGFTPSHLKEHRLFSQRVLVSYVEKGGRLVAVKVDD